MFSISAFFALRFPYKFYYINHFYFQAGEGQLGTDEAELLSVLATSNNAQLRATFDAYASISDKDIVDAIAAETSGTLQDGYMAISK